MLELIFWASVLLIFHAYFGYPLSLYLWSKVHNFIKLEGPPVTLLSKFSLPTVTVLITAANEEKHIADKIANTLALDYPANKLQIVIALDYPTDNTENIARAFAGFEIVVAPNKIGKERAQKLALSSAKGEIIVFTDATTVLNPNTLRLLVAHFADPRVGSVDGMNKLIDDKGAGEGVYIKYENHIRKLESQCGGLVTLGGCLFAARKEVCDQFDFTVESDFGIALTTKKCGLHSVIDTVAVGLIPDLADPSKEYNRKHRTIVRGFNTFSHHLFLLNPFKYGIFSYQLFCHKLLKWMVPLALVSALVANVCIVLFELLDGSSAFYSLTLIIQSGFYFLASCDMANPQFKNSLVKIAGFFLSSNAAIVHAWYSYIRGERFVSWESSKR